MDDPPALAAAVVVLVTLAVLLWPRRDVTGELRHRGETSVGRGPGRRPRRPAAGKRARAAPAGATVLDVASAADLLALALEAGAGVTESLEAVAERTGGPVAAHLSSVAAGRRWGLSDASAWAMVDEAWAPVARALRLADLAGVPPGRLLGGAAREIREAERHRVQLAIARLRVSVVLPLGLCFLPAFVLTTIVPVVLSLAGRALAP